MITLMERAAASVKAMREREGRSAAALRLRVTAGGCAESFGV
jgi:Fe-S cluster assembly iron-binding protein IscA